MMKIAFINQRYGLEVNGGSEYYTRLLAEHLNGIYEVEVLTTKALDHVTWANHYKKETETLNGVLVRRFPVVKERNIKEFSVLTEKMFSSVSNSEEEEENWLIEQGPFCPELDDYIRLHKDDYDIFVFVTYMYYSTCVCIRNVWDKAVLIPTAHDEPDIYFNIYKDVFTKCRSIIYLTEEEKTFVEKVFHNQEIPNTVTAIGIDVPDFAENNEIAKKINSEHYIVYVGRVEPAKGCSALFQYFSEYKKRNENDLKLVLMGKTVMDIPKHKDIVYLGFVSEEEKFSCLSNADALVLPSQFESLSIAVLEAMQVKTPVIVNGTCEVLKGHCVKSNAGLYYKDYFEFEGIVNYMLNHPEVVVGMGENAVKYINTFYRWDIVIKKLKGIFEGED